MTIFAVEIKLFIMLVLNMFFKSVIKKTFEICGALLKHTVPVVVTPQWHVKVVNLVAPSLFNLFFLPPPEGPSDPYSLLDLFLNGSSASSKFTSNAV